jgi:hypothetical protein
MATLHYIGNKSEFSASLDLIAISFSYVLRVASVSHTNIHAVTHYFGLWCRSLKALESLFEFPNRSVNPACLLQMSTHVGASTIRHRA